MDRWFPGRARDADGEAFLTALRARASADGLLDAHPEDTAAVEDAYGDAVVARVRPPGLAAGDDGPCIQVGFGLAAVGGPALVGEWEAWGYVLDSSFEPVDVTGVPSTPAALAGRAHGWLVEQLRRPVERREWRTWRGRTVAATVLADTGVAVHWSAGAWRRRRPSARVVRLRG